MGICFGKILPSAGGKTVTRLGFGGKGGGGDSFKAVLSVAD